MRRRRLLYLHGFASSSQSSKAAWLAARGAGEGLEVEAPDLNAPDFSTLTITRMIRQTCDRLARAPGPATLVGSSLGAIVALFAAAELARAREAFAPDTLVLLAPAVDLVPDFTARFGPEGLAEWERTDRFDVFHYGDQAIRPLRWSFFEDARQYEPWRVEPPVPTLVIQGTRDEVVDPEAVRRWARGRRLVTLHMVDDGHQLLNSLDDIWSAMRAFLPVSA